jgi:hypothetical protein
MQSAVGSLLLREKVREVTASTDCNRFGHTLWAMQELRGD